MARKKPCPTGGSQSRQRLGLRLIGVPVTPQVRQAVHQAAALADQFMGAWSASVLERAARESLASHGLPFPGEEVAR